MVSWPPVDARDIPMSRIKDFVKRIPVLGRAILCLHRYRVARSYLTPKWRLIRPWLFSSRETTNFTYDLEPANVDYLASFVAEITGRRFEEAIGFIRELDGDEDLKRHVRTVTAQDPRYRRVSDPEPRFGRRAGWYAVVRAFKPKVVVETGIDKGLGSVVIASALLRNTSEGHPGRYYGTDINPDAGFLFRDRYAQTGRILHGDSIGSLTRLDERIDLFVNDSDHSADYEGREYRTVEAKLSDHAVILGDNADSTDELFRFARRTGRSFLFFQERPKNHWYPGAGIGAAFRRAGR
jgi:hypothetical protein